MLTDVDKNNIDCILNNMKNYANRNNVPIVRPDAASFLTIIGRIMKPSRILEIGTAIGYSALLFSKILADNGRIDTIERNNDMLRLAQENIKIAKKQKQINIIEGQAAEVLNFLDGKYDMIFLDGAKGKYKEFLYDCNRLLRKGGVLIADNVLYKGMIEGDKVVKRRNRTIVRNLREYIDEIKKSDYFETSVIQLADGMSISYKIKD